MQTPTTGRRSESNGKTTWMQGCRTRQEIGESVSFVSALFEILDT